MTKDTIVTFRAPDGFSPDPLTDLLRQGARELIAQAVEGLRQVVDAHACRLVQQRMEQVLLGTAKPFEHQNLSGNCLTSAAVKASASARICSRIIPQVRASPA